MEFERARNQEQKNVRRDQIIKAALKLYETEPFEKITLASIASELSFSRANLYKYVTTKEEIFLWILNSDLEKWVAQVSERLREYEQLELKDFCRIWAELLDLNQRIIRLFPILSSAFEKNAKATTLTTFRQELDNNMDSLKAISSKFLPYFSSRQLDLFIRYQILYALNLYTEIVFYEKRSAVTGLLNKKPDFIADFSEYLEIIILGLRTKSD